MNYKRRSLIFHITLILVAASITNTNAQTFSAGFNHALFNCASGTPECVGSNTSGQLGLGTWVSHSTPVQVSALNGIIAVDATYGNSLFLKNDGTVWAVGANGNGQLGNGTTTSEIAPVRVLGLTGITAIAASIDFSIFLKNDGTVWGVGNNTNGQLGDGTTVSKTTAVQVMGLTGITAISAGMAHSLFLKNDGTVWATGSNYYGQIGNQPYFGVQTPVEIAGASGITAIAAGGTHSLFLKNDQTVWGVGSNAYGQLGNSNVGHYIYNAFQIEGLSGISKLAGGFLFSLFLNNNGTVLASGANTYGQLGDNSTTDKSIPTAIPGLNGVIAIDAGVHFSMFLKSDGTLKSVGNNNSGQLGDGTNIQRLTPVLVNNVCANSLSIVQNHDKEALAVYPNPCHERLFIETTNFNLENGDTIVELSTLQGQLLKSTVLKTPATALLINDLKTGIYFVTIKSAKGVYSKKIVKN
ncbi:T9SS type A sorting domain-containing protein [Flavobacterium sp.]|uniref:RCC1 domain-containing protein n=1 Tax=Flavobacterium sp. TaxID=239 RepID=UPI00261DA33B|nr:T9SS type A sorting domain-containing protein [Flavobacterium sp.]